MKPPSILLLTLLAVTAWPAAQGQEAAHMHGVVHLDVAVEARSITLQIESPLDNLVGFEHPPRTDAQKQAARRAIALLQAGGELFRIDPAAGCTFKRAALEAPALGLGDAPNGAAESAHADLDGTYEFTCTAGGRAAFIDLGLMEGFPAVRSVQAQVVGPAGQFRREVMSPARRLAWGR